MQFKASCYKKFKRTKVLVLLNRKRFSFFCVDPPCRNQTTLNDPTKKAAYAFKGTKYLFGEWSAETEDHLNIDIALHTLHNLSRKPFITFH